MKISPLRNTPIHTTPSYTLPPPPPHTHANTPCTNSLDSLFPDNGFPGGPSDPSLALVVVVSVQPVLFIAEEKCLLVLLHLANLLEFLF